MEKSIEILYIPDDLLDAWETVIRNPDKVAGEIFQA